MGIHMGIQIALNVPGQPHRWSAEIAAWARGDLVQWRYDLRDIEDKPLSDWRDCSYPSRGMPNWEHPDIEYRVAPTTEEPING